MLCERCKIREANIKYTEIINGVKTEHNLCSHCAREMDFGQYTAFIDGDFPLGRLLSGLLGLADDEEETEVRGRVVCPTCGTSFDDFVENSRFGCPDCYGVFDLFINDKMKQLQGSESHKGKHPKFRSKFEKEHPDSVKKGGSAAEDSAGAEVLSFGPENFEGGGDAALAKKIRELDRKLKEALREEAYEEAAAYRDQIRALKAEAGAKAGTGAKASADAKAGAGADSANSAKASAGEEAATHE